MADESEISIDGKPLSSLRVVDLRDELKKRGVKSSGTKKYLQDLLKLELDKEKQQSSDDIAPNLALKDDKLVEENEIVKQYLAERNEMYQQQVEYRRQIQQSGNEENENDDTDESATQNENENDDRSENSMKMSVNDTALDLKITEKNESQNANVPIEETKSESIVANVLSPTKGNGIAHHSDDKSSDKKEIIESNDEIIDYSKSESSIKCDESITNKTEITDKSQNETKDLKDTTIESNTSNLIITEDSENTDESLSETKDLKDATIESNASNLIITEDSENTDESQSEAKDLTNSTIETDTSNLKDKTITERENIISDDVKDSTVEDDKSDSTDKNESDDTDRSHSATKSPDSVKDEAFQEKSESKVENAETTTDKSAERSQIEAESIGSVKDEERAETRVESIEESKEHKEIPLISTSSSSAPKAPRKRRWGGAASSIGEGTQNISLGISSNKLKELIPDFDTNTDQQKVSTSESNKSLPQMRGQTLSTNADVPSKRDIRVVRKSTSLSEDTPGNVNDQNVGPNRIQLQQQQQQLNKQEDMEYTDERTLSPPKNPESNIIFIRNLVRPFTLILLKEVLAKNGKLIEEQFWIDKIKSKCYATYESVDEAIAARAALHGQNWPLSNPKTLIVDFATKEELQYHLDIEKGVNKEQNTMNRPNFEITKSVNNDKCDIIIRPERDVKNNREKLNEGNVINNQKIEDRPIREWDREKLIKKDESGRVRKRRSRSRSHSQEKADKRRRHGNGDRIFASFDDRFYLDSTRGGMQNRDPNPKESGPVKGSDESPAKLLDDLFKKTKSTPCIYWLPLTEEQTIKRDNDRAELEKKRVEERAAREEQLREDVHRRERDGPPRIEPNTWGKGSPPLRGFAPLRRPSLRRVSPNRPPRRSPPFRRSPPQRRPSPRRSPPRRPYLRTSASRSRSPVRRRSPPRRGPPRWKTAQ